MLGERVYHRTVEGRAREELVFLASLAMVYATWAIYTGKRLEVLLSQYLSF
jgi:hypothetical protein